MAVWVQHGAAPAILVLLVDNKLNLKSLSERLQLNVNSLKAGDLALDADASGMSRDVDEIKAFAGMADGGNGSKSCPFVIEGEAIRSLDWGALTHVLQKLDGLSAGVSVTGSTSGIMFSHAVTAISSFPFHIYGMSHTFGSAAVPQLPHGIGGGFAPPGPGVSGVKTPSRAELAKLLQERQLRRGSTKDQVVDWVQELPIPPRTKDFLTNHLVSVVDGKHLQGSVVENSGQPGVFRRWDFQQVLESKPGAKVVVLSGRRRQGKTVALPMEVVHARKGSSGVQDQVVFYHSGNDDLEDDIPLSSLNTSVLVLTYARIPVCWDEFQCGVKQLGRAYKFLMESVPGDIDVLSVIMWGSSEPEVLYEAGPLVSGLMSRGGFTLHLPDPSIEVLVGVYHLSKGHYDEKDPSSSELLAKWDSGEFLRRFTLCGYDLQRHVALASSSEVSVGDFEDVLLKGIRGYGKFKHALERIVGSGGKIEELQQDERIVLRRRKYISTHPQDASRVVFANPELAAFSVLRAAPEPLTMRNCTDAEGRVLEVLVRSRHLLLPQLVKVIENKGKLELEGKHEKFLKAAEQVRFGTFSVDIELDGFFRFEVSLFILCIKRCLSAQSMESTTKLLTKLEDRVRKQAKNGNLCPPGWELVDEETKQIVVVEVSAVEDGVPKDVSEYTQCCGKNLTRISVTLKDVVEFVSPEFVRFSSD